MCRAQTYDGVGNMASKEKGAAAKFCSETGNKKAVYFHCTSRGLNLFLSKAPKILQVMNIVSTMQMLRTFLSAPRNVNKNWKNLLQKLLLNHLKRKSNYCLKHIGWRRTGHL